MIIINHFILGILENNRIKNMIKGFENREIISLKSDFLKNDDTGFLLVSKKNDETTFRVQTH